MNWFKEPSNQLGTSTAQEKHKNEEVKNELATLNYKKERDKYIF